MEYVHYHKSKAVSSNRSVVNKTEELSYKNKVINKMN